MRRSPSVSSVGSAASAARRNAPQSKRERSGSVGSMSERSFRSPSPHGDRRPLKQNHPPVPAIPPGHKASKSTSSAGVGMQNFKTASQKLDTNLPSWYTQSQGDTSNVRTSDAPMRAGRPESLNSLPQRSDSRNSSINFSYPGRARAPSSSPTVDHNPQWSESPRRDKANRSSSTSNASGKPDQTLVYDPNSRRMVPKSTIEAVSYQVKSASEKPPKTKKSQTGVQRSGSHLAKGTVARVRGSMVETGEQSRELPEHEESFVGTQYYAREEPQVQEDAEIESDVTAWQPVQSRNLGGQIPSPEPQDSRFSTPSPVPQEPRRITSPRSVGQVGRKPSIVREDPEEDLEYEYAQIPTKEVYGALDNVPTRQTLYESDREQETVSRSKPEPVNFAGLGDQPQGQPDAVDFANASERHSYLENKPVAGLARDASAPKRSLSQSPARQARFAPTPSDSLNVRHTPLPRSASPIKSALKHSTPSPRDASPADNNVSDAPRARFSSPEREVPGPRKKSVRVSFDERGPVIVGESHGSLGDTDSPIMPSPQSRRPWYSSIGRNKKKDAPLEDDEVMQPRPALPMFGSVREKKIREPEEQERPLIRPHDPPSSPIAPASFTEQPHNAQSTTTDPYTVNGQASDQIIGSVLSQAQQDNASRNEANISRFREPLPPVVTSVEGGSDLSDSMKSSDDEAGLFDTARDDSDEEVIPSTQTTAITMPESQVNSQNGSTILEGKSPVEFEQPGARAGPALAEPAMETVPAIAITQPSPAPVDENMSTAKHGARQYFGLPGMFPEDDSDDSQVHQEQQHIQATPNSIPSSTAEAMKEPEAVVAPSQTHVLPQTILATTPRISMPENTTDDESNASIYSDAYEDVSDVEDGGGFQSLNAVVESPVTKPLQADRVPEPAVERNQSAEVAPFTQNSAAATQAFGLTYPETDWEQAKSFWRGLTAEKRRQLEIEAMEDAAADGDQEELQTPTRKLSNRIKKTAEQRLATAVAQAAQAQAAQAQAAQAQAAQAQTIAPMENPKQENRVNPERTYMIQPGSRANHEPLSPVKSAGHARTSSRGEQSQAAKSGILTKNNPGQVHIRSSMRGEPPQSAKSRTVSQNVPGEVHIRKSMRPGSTNGDASRRISSPPERVTSPSATVRPRTAGAPEDKATRRGRAASNEVAASAAAAFSRTTVPAPQRRGSDASDSSFKRARPNASESTTFRRTMRHGAAPAQPHAFPEATKDSSRFSLRSLSPSGSTFHRSSAAAPPVSTGMRRSLRSGSVSSKDSKRASVQFPSFGRPSGKAAAKKTNAGSSRFGDSSDEEEPTPRFRSRFDDSSDEDDVRPGSSSRPLAKGTLRGSTTAPTNPKKATPPVVEEEAEDSPDLPDSDDEPSMQLPSPLRSPGNTASAFRPGLNQRASSGIGTSTLQRQRSGPGTLAASSTAPVAVRPASERRSSFMSNILRRNKKADKAGKITRPELMDSPARRDTKFERSTDELRTLRGDSRPTSPKLQKRNTFSRGDSWPLPEGAEDVRPTTAGGRVNGSAAQRPDFAGRRSTSLGIPGLKQPSGHGVADETILDGHDPTKKKKKFGALRRMFRLDD
ncbi:hypothetical protein SCUP234_10051 [Seiridium cupressi]